MMNLININVIDAQSIRIIKNVMQTMFLIFKNVMLF